MHKLKARFALPKTVQPGDRVPAGRGPWAIVEGVERARGRQPQGQKRISLILKNRNQRLNVPIDLPIRVLRNPKDV